MQTRKNYVRWADGTYDTQRTCSDCPDPACPNPTHAERYSEITTSRDYTDWMATNAPYGVDEDGDFLESPAANPDLISEEAFDGNPLVIPVTSRDYWLQVVLPREAYKSLTQRQKEVWDLCMRQNQSELDAARMLGRDQSTISRTLKLAKERFEQFINESLDNEK